MAVVAQSNGFEAGTLKERTGAVPARRVTKEQLLKTHKTHLQKQDLSPNAPRPVKQPILSEAYPASIKSIRDVEIVRTLPFFRPGLAIDCPSRYL